MFKKFTAFLLVTLMAFSMFITVSFAATAKTGTAKRTLDTIERYVNGHYVTANYMKGEVIVKYKSGYSEKSIASLLYKFSARKVKTIAKGQYTLLRMKDTATVEKFLKYVKNEPGILYAAPNYAYEFPDTGYKQKISAAKANGSKASAAADDPLLANQWFHDTVNLYDAWAVTKGDPSVKVAVIDSGADTEHPDLSGQFYKVRDFSKTPYVDNRTSDTVGHGTHVSGIIAAKANNGIGVAGVAPNVKLLMADISTDDDLLGSFFTEESVTDAIYWSVDQGARVINLSLSTTVYEETPLMKAAIKYADDHGVIVVCAAGNDAAGDDVPEYPSDDPNAVSVISVDSDKDMSYFSNYGASKEISAPGGMSVYTGKGILSTVPRAMKDDTDTGDAYDYYEGTSMAAPVVSGVFALLFSQFPGLTANQAKDIIFDTAQDDAKHPGKDIYLGYGVIDAKAALAEAAARVGSVTNAAVTPATPVLGVTPGAAISFDTNKDGYVTVKIKKNGDTIKTLCTDAARPAGAASVSWDFTNDNGETVGNIGEYQAEIAFRTTADTDGYITAPVNVSFTLDAPAMNITGGGVSPAAPLEQTHGNFTVSASLDQKGELKAYIYKDGVRLVRTLSSGQKDLSANPIALTWDQKDADGKYVEAGNYTVKVSGVDRYGRESAPVDAGTLQITADTTAPVLSDGGGNAAFTNNGTEPYIRNLALSEPGFYTVKIYRGGVSQANLVRTCTLDAVGGGTDTFAWNGKRDNGLYAASGTYTFVASAKDLIGNTGNTASFAVNVTDATSLAITGSLSASTVKPKVQKLTVNYSISENALVTMKVYDGTGKAVRTLINSKLKQKGANSLKWDLKKSSGSYIPDGIYRVKISGDDGNGKGSNIRELSFTVNSDNKKPSVTIGHVSARTYKNYGTKPLTVGFKVSEKAKSATMEISRSGRVVRSYKLLDLAADKTYSFSWDGKDKSGVYVRSGSYSVKIKAVDLAGNVSRIAGKSVYVRDYTKPVVTVPKSVDYDYYKGGNASISVKLSEPAYVTAKVYDSFGDYVFTLANRKSMKAGNNTLRFNGKTDKAKRIAPYLYPLEVRFTATDANGNKLSGYETTLLGGEDEEDAP